MSLLFVTSTLCTIAYAKFKAHVFPEKANYETLSSMSDFNKNRLQQGQVSPIPRNDSEFSLGLNRFELEIQPGEFCKEGQIAIIVTKYIAIGTAITLGGALLSKKLFGTKE